MEVNNPFAKRTKAGAELLIWIVRTKGQLKGVTLKDRHSRKDQTRGHRGRGRCETVYLQSVRSGEQRARWGKIEMEGGRERGGREGEGAVEIGDCCSFKERDPTCVD